MVVESFACPACAEQIAPGRLSCPQCGTVLAAVARSWRSEAAQPDVPPVVARPSAPSWLDVATAPEQFVEPAGGWPDRANDGWDDDAPLAAASDGDAEPPAVIGADVEPAADVPEPETAPIPTPVAALLHRAPEAWQAAGEEPTDEAGEPVDDSELVTPPASADAPAAPAWFAPASSVPAPTGSLLRPAGRPNPFLDIDPPSDAPPAGAVPEPDPEPAAAPTPAAYVPPATTAVPASTPADPPARILPRAWDPAAAAAERSATEAPPPSAGLAALRSRLPVPSIDRSRVDEVAGVVVLAGAMGSAIGFLLPWSRAVIGSRGAGSYFDTWGLAGQAHLVVFLLVLGALALAAVPNRVDTWLRTGVVGIALGALLLGLAWPYAFGPLGAGVGIVLLVVSACLLLLGGLLSTLVQRHGAPPPGV